MRQLTAYPECFDLAKPFSTAMGTIESLTVLRVELRDGAHVGQGECVPSAAKMVSRQQGQQIAAAAHDHVRQVQSAVENGATPTDLLQLMPACPARNAIDCALWDLRAKQSGRPIAELLGLNVPESLVTACTIALAEPAVMAAEANELRDRSLLKLKLGRVDDEAIVAAVHRAAPGAALVVDVNGGWSFDRLREMSMRLRVLGVKLIEQPLPLERDSELADFTSPVPLAADESCRDRADLPTVAARYDYINIKLDKTGGLTEALALLRAARALGLDVMVGCMAGTSLSMAPAVLVASLADVVDLDGPLLLSTDRPHGMLYRGDRIFCINPALWG